MGANGGKKGAYMMAYFWILIGIILASVAIRYTHVPVYNTKLVSNGKHVAHMIPHALSVVILVDHAYELPNIIHHITLTHIIAAFALFLVLMAAKSGSETL